MKTLEVVNPQQIDIAKIDPTKTKTKPTNLPLYDRALTLEVWYPAATNSKGKNTLDVYLRDGKTKVALHGRAVRDAIPLKSSLKFPLVLVSHGYPGNRFLMSHLAENIASKGYVVVSIDHTDSTYRTQAAFGSTLVNRPLDQLFTLDKIEAMSKDPSSFLHQLVDVNNTALIGYSMGGYGAVIMAGAGITEGAVDFPRGVPHQILNMHKNGSKTQQQRPDPRLKTVVAFAPWGMNYGVWDKESLQNVNRALLTFDNANHSAGAPMPAPEESYVYDETLGFNISEHYTDAVWDSVRMNNISQHFTTVWLDKYLKNKTEMDNYLKLEVNSNDGVWSKDDKGQPKADHTHWTGFKNRTAKGLRFEKLAKGE